MIHKGLFIFAHQCGDTSFYGTYTGLVKNQWKPYAELILDQEKQLRHMVEFAYQNVPYYHELFRGLGLRPTDVKHIKDLEKLPVLTKGMVYEQWEKLKPTNLNLMKYSERFTGGSTGTRLKYRLSTRDRFMSGAILYRGWGYGGFELGDKTVFLAGTSLNVGIKPTLSQKVHELARNIRMLSSFDMGELEMRQYAAVLQSFKPRFITGYASAIDLFSRWLQSSRILDVHLDGVFTTSEKLFPHQRKNIAEAFGCEVYDTYGLNDGGVSAFECPHHTGLHIDTDRSVMEVVDDEGRQMRSGEGRILATSLHNYAMPFIRYVTGDLGRIVDEECGCGREYPLLKEVIGRSTDILVTPDGRNIHGLFLSSVFDHCIGVKGYQIVQKNKKDIIIRIVPEDSYSEGQEAVVRQMVNARVPEWDIEFRYVDEIERTEGGKMKLIISEVDRG